MSITCDNCMEKVSGTVLFCSNCGKYMCEECSKVIHTFKAFKTHEVEAISLASCPPVQPQPQPQPPASEPTTAAATVAPKGAFEVCTQHNTHARLFCEDCKELCCYYCICDGGKHVQHRTVLFKDAYEVHVSAAGAASEKLSSALAKAEDGRSLLEGEVAGCQLARAEAAQEACSAMERLDKAVRDRAAVLGAAATEKASSAAADMEALLADTRRLRAEVAAAAEKLEQAGAAHERPSVFLVVREASSIERGVAALDAKNRETLERTAVIVTAVNGANNNSTDTVVFKAMPSKCLSQGASEDNVLDMIKSFGNVCKTCHPLSLKNSKVKVKLIKPPKKEAQITTIATTTTTTAPAPAVPTSDTASGVKKEAAKKQRDYIVSWDRSIAQPLRDVVEMSESAVYMLEMKGWDGKVKGDEEAAAKYAVVYSGKGTECELRGIATQNTRVKLSICDKGGAYKLWESKPQGLGSCMGTYDGVFRECPNVKFSDNEHRIVSRDSSNYTTAVGTEPLTAGDVSVFYIHVVATNERNNGTSLGVVPSDVELRPGQDIRTNYGWYLNFYHTQLYSGPPQRRSGNSYGNRNDIKSGDIIRVTFDATGEKGVLSYALNGEDLGVAFNDIPLDKPLLPAVFIYGRTETIELCPPDYSPPELWDEDIDGAGLDRLPAGSGWKECPATVTDNNLRYKRPDDINPRIARKVDVNSSTYCSIIGDTPIAVGTESYWKVRMINANGGKVFSGVAPADIDQTVKKNYKCCGWYFRWERGALYSGPPQNYHKNSYSGTQGTHSGSTVGHILDTTDGTSGKLSFIVNNKDAGVAYEGIPLDKPLVPCVLLFWAGDTVELVL